MTCCESTQEKLEATLQGEGMVQSDPLDEIKEESMSHPEKGKKEAKDDKIISSGQDVVRPASPAKEANTSDVVVTNILKQKTLFITVTVNFNSFHMSFIGP